MALFSAADFAPTVNSPNAKNQLGNFYGWSAQQLADVANQAGNNQSALAYLANTGGVFMGVFSQKFGAPQWAQTYNTQFYNGFTDSPGQPDPLVRSIAQGLGGQNQMEAGGAYVYAPGGTGSWASTTYGQQSATPTPIVNAGTDGPPPGTQVAVDGGSFLQGNPNAAPPTNSNPTPPVVTSDPAPSGGIPYAGPSNGPPGSNWLNLPGIVATNPTPPPPSAPVTSDPVPPAGIPPDPAAPSTTTPPSQGLGSAAAALAHSQAQQNASTNDPYGGTVWAGQNKAVASSEGANLNDDGSLKPMAQDMPNTAGQTGAIPVKTGLVNSGIGS